MDPAGEFQDWELLHSASDPEEDPHPVDFHPIDAHSGGLIDADYFSADPSGSRPVSGAADASEVGSESSDGVPSWVDPGSGLDARYPTKDAWSDSGSDDRKFSELEEVGHEGNDEKSGGSVVEEGSFEQDSQLGPVEIAKSEGKKEDREKSVVWWKVPIDFLRYCVFRGSPVWTISVAAAFMGFVLLGRRLYRMKRKTRGLELKVTVDDKKISQFMSKAARLNEAFSVVKRVPVIRPSLPAVGVTPWPVMSLR